jgi:hypothetical protein
MRDESLKVECRGWKRGNGLSVEGGMEGSWNVEVGREEMD